MAKQTWTYEEYWNVVFGSKRTPADLVEEFNLGNIGAQSWVGDCEREAISACDLPRDETWDLWEGFRERSTRELLAAISRRNESH